MYNKFHRDYARGFELEFTPAEFRELMNERLQQTVVDPVFPCL